MKSASRRPGRIRRSGDGHTRRSLGQSRQARTVGDARGVFFRPRRGALVVGRVEQGAVLLVAEAGAVLQVHCDGGDVVEGALAGLVGAGDFDALLGGKGAGCYAGDGRGGRGAGGGGYGS